MAIHKHTQHSSCFTKTKHIVNGDILFTLYLAVVWCGVCYGVMECYGVLWCAVLKFVMVLCGVL